MAAIQRHLLHRRSRDDVANGGRHRIDERHLGAHDHGFRSLADHQHEIADQRTADVDVQRFDQLSPKP